MKRYARKEVKTEYYGDINVVGSRVLEGVKGETFLEPGYVYAPYLAHTYPCMMKDDDYEIVDGNERAN